MKRPIKYMGRKAKMRWSAAAQHWFYSFGDGWWPSAPSDPQQAAMRFCDQLNVLNGHRI